MFISRPRLTKSAVLKAGHEPLYQIAHIAENMHARRVFLQPQSQVSVYFRGLVLDKGVADNQRERHIVWQSHGTIVEGVADQASIGARAAVQAGAVAAMSDDIALPGGEDNFLSRQV